jgi:hypothetical protein
MARLTDFHHQEAVSADGGQRHPRGRRQPGVGGKQRACQGGSIPLPTLSCDGVQRRIDSGGGEEWCRLCVATQGKLGEESGMAVAMRGEAGNATGSFYSCGEGGNSANTLLAGHVQPAMVEEAVREGSGVDLASGIRGGGMNAVLLDGTRRPVSSCELAVSGATRCGAAVGVRRRCWRGDDGSAWWINGGSSARSPHGAGEAAVIGWLGSDVMR